MGIAALRKGKTETAHGLLSRAISCDPKRTDFHVSLGRLYETTGKFEKAESIFRASFEADPLSSVPALNLADFFARNGRISEAEAVYNYVLGIDPGSYAAQNNLGNLRQAMEDHEGAEALYRKALEIKPDLIEAMNNLGMALTRQRRFVEAEKWLKDAVGLKADFIEAIDNYGSALMEQGKFEEAREQYLKVLSLKPDHAGSAFNLSYIMLMNENFSQGLPLYEKRLEKPEFHYLKDTRSLKRGMEVENTTILVRCDQGLGDTLQFVRFLPALKERGARVYLESQPQLKALLSGCEGIDLIIPKTGQAVPDVRYDHSVPLLSLPYVLGTTVDTIPACVPYIRIDSRVSEKWRAMTDARRDDGTLLVGIAWSGNKRYTGDVARSLTLEDLIPLITTAGTRCYSLQYGDAVKEAENIPPSDNFIIMTDEISNFTDTAGLIGSLDLIISIDSVICHLSGALGVPVWTLLPYVSDWRWFLGREGSPWYPTMRLFRQTALGNWEDVLKRVHDALKELLDRRPQ